jgi:hypothetical protein|uniref:Isoprenylcysteine carboxylmethyltransferase family protein n=1 Tax=candidate division WOR-3 bacterium TaxID=2052148 RepID=A0A7V3VUK9_UNCW3
MPLIVKIGIFLYYYRSLIAIPFFILLFFFKNPDNNLLPHLFIISGVLLRLWSSGYIGKKARSRTPTAECRIKGGPYTIFKHPLYIGNFFLVLGTVLLYNPPLWLKFFLIFAFIFEYSIITIAEEYNLKGLNVCYAKFCYKNMVSEFSTIMIIGIIYLLIFIFDK